MTDMPGGGQNLGTAVGRIVIDVSSLQRSVDAVEAAASKISSALQGINTAYKGMGTGLNAGIQSAAKGAQSAAGQINNMSTALNKANTSGVRLTNTFERLAEYVFSFSAIFSAVNFAGQALQAARAIDVANIRFNQLTGSAAESRVEMEKLRDTAKEFGIPVNQAMDLFAGLVPLIENGRSSLQDYVKVMARMVLLSPEQGFQGAAFAIREALASLGEGKRDFVSLSERFEIPKGLLRTALDQTGGDLAQGMDIVLNKLGITEDAARSMGQTFDASLKMMGDEFKRFAATAIKPLLDGVQPVIKAMSDFMGVFVSTNPELIKTVGSIAAMVGTLGALKYIMRELKKPFEDIFKAKGAFARFAMVGLPALSVGTGIGQSAMGGIASLSDEEFSQMNLGAFKGFRDTVRKSAQDKVDELFGADARKATEYVNTQYNQQFNPEDKASRQQAREFAFRAFIDEASNQEIQDSLKKVVVGIVALLATFGAAIVEVIKTIGQTLERLKNVVIPGRGLVTDAEFFASNKLNEGKSTTRETELLTKLGISGTSRKEAFDKVSSDLATRLAEISRVHYQNEEIKIVAAQNGIANPELIPIEKQLTDNLAAYEELNKIYSDEIQAAIESVKGKPFNFEAVLQENLKNFGIMAGVIKPPSTSKPAAGFVKQKEPLLTSDQFSAFRDYMTDLNNMAKEYEAQRVALRKENEIDRQKIQDKYNAQRKKTQERFDQDEIERIAKRDQDIADINKDSAKKLVEMRMDFAEDEEKRMRDHLRRLNELNADIADAAGKLDAVAVRRLQDQKAKEERDFRENRDERRAEQTKKLAEEQASADERIEQLKLNYDREKKLRDDNLKRDLQTITDIEAEEQATRESGFIEKIRQLKEQEDQERTLRDQRFIDELAALGDHNAAMLKQLQAGNEEQRKEAKKFIDGLIGEYKRRYDEMVGSTQINSLTSSLAGTPFGDILNQIMDEGLLKTVATHSNKLIWGYSQKDSKGETSKTIDMGTTVADIFRSLPTLIDNINQALTNAGGKEISDKLRNFIKDTVANIKTAVGFNSEVSAIPDAVLSGNLSADDLKVKFQDAATETAKTASAATSFNKRVKDLAGMVTPTSTIDLRSVLQNALNNIGSIFSWLSSSMSRITGQRTAPRTGGGGGAGVTQMTQFATGTPRIGGVGAYLLHGGEGVMNSTNGALARAMLGQNYTQNQLAQFMKGGNGGNVSFQDGSIVLNISGGGEPYAIKTAVKDAMAEVIHEYVARRTR